MLMRRPKRQTGGCCACHPDTRNRDGRWRRWLEWGVASEKQVRGCPLIVIILLLLLVIDVSFFLLLPTGSLTLEREGKIKREAHKRFWTLPMNLPTQVPMGSLLVSFDWEEARRGAAVAVAVSNIALDIV